MIRVVIERKLASHMVQTFHDAVRSARADASHFPGFISGETLHDLDNPNRYVVIMTWKKRDDWERWAGSEERRRFLAATTPCLDEPETYLVLEPI